MVAYAPETATKIQAWAQINNQASPLVPIETFDIQLAAYGSIGHFTFTTAISALASHGWAGPNDLLGIKIEDAQPSLADGSPSYPIKLYVTGAYDSQLHLVFAGDIDELSWTFDTDELKVTGRDYGGRMMDWRAILTPKWTNMTYGTFAATIINGVNLTPAIADKTVVEKQLGALLYSIGNEAGNVARVSFGYTHSGFPYETSVFSTPQNMWELLNLVSRAIGFIVTVHNDGTVYVGPPGGDKSLDLTPRVFTWFAAEGTPNTTPVRNLTINHGPRQYGTFVVRGFGYHPPTVGVTSSSVVGLAGNSTQSPVTVPLLSRQPLTAGVYKSGRVAAAVQAGKPNYFYFFHGQNAAQIERNIVGITFDIARHLYIVEGELDGDPTLLPTTRCKLAEAKAGSLQGYASKPLDIASVNHTFDMRGGDAGGFLTKFKAWYEPPAQSLPPLPGQVGQPQVTG